MNSTHRPALLRGLTVFAIVTAVHAVIVLAVSSAQVTSHETSSGVRILESVFVVDAGAGGPVNAPEPVSAPVTEPVSEPVAEATQEPQVTEPEPRQIAEAPFLPTQEEQPTQADAFVPEKPPEPKQVEKKPPVKKPVVRQATAASKPSTPDSMSASSGAKPASPPGDGDVTMPISNAAYLNNPHPPYPRVSRRLREEGRVLLAVEIDVDGHASQAVIKRSSGFERLDQAALQTVLKWRFVPGKQAGIAKKMWVNIPINFVLE